MPMRSQAQRRYLHAVHPEIAAEFEAATPKGTKLPEHVGDADPNGTIEKDAAAAWRTPAGLAALSARLPSFAAGTSRVSQLSQVKAKLGLGQHLPGIEAKVQSLPPATLPFPQTLERPPTTLYRGHTHADPSAGGYQQLHGSPFPQFASPYGGAATPSGSIRQVTSYAAPADQRYHEHWGLERGAAGKTHAEMWQEADPKPLLSRLLTKVVGGSPVRNPQALSPMNAYETDVRGLAPSGRFIVPSSSPAVGGGVAAREFPPTPANDSFWRQMTAPAVPLPAAETAKRNAAFAAHMSERATAMRTGKPLPAAPVFGKAANAFAYDAAAVPIGFERLPKGPLRSGYSSAMLEPLASPTTSLATASSVKTPHTPAPSVGSGNTTRIWRPQPRGPGRLGLLAGLGGAALGVGTGVGLTQLLKKGGDYLFDAEDCPKCGASMEGDPYTGTCNSCQHKWGYKKAAHVPHGGTVSYDYHCTPCDHSFDHDADGPHGGNCPLCGKDRSSTTTNPRLRKSAMVPAAQPQSPAGAPGAAGMPGMTPPGMPGAPGGNPTVVPGVAGLGALKRPQTAMAPAQTMLSQPKPTMATAAGVGNSLMKAALCPPRPARLGAAYCALPGLSGGSGVVKLALALRAGAANANSAFGKYAMPLPAVPGMTANAPVAPQGQPQAAPPLPPTPPPSTAPMAMGNGQPSFDPATGQPVPPAPGTQPPPPPGQPAQGQQTPQQNPPPGQPGNVPTAPMQDPMQPPLPANPAMSQPRMPLPSDHQQATTMDSLMGEKIDADAPMTGPEATSDMKAEAFGMGGKLASDNVLNPRAIGEGSIGNPGMKWHESDRGTTGNDALSALPKYMRNAAKKKNIDPFKLAGDITPFAMGFLHGCEKHDLDPEAAFAKVGEDYGTEALCELADMFEKCAVGLPELKAGAKGVQNFFKGMWGATPHTPPPIPKPPMPNVSSVPGMNRSAPLVAGPSGSGYLPRTVEQAAPGYAAGHATGSAVNRAAGTAGGWGNAMKGQMAGSVGGAISGGFAGNSLGLPGAVGDEGNPRFNLGGAALGALAGNRRLGQFVSKPGAGRAIADTGMTAFRRAGIGNMAGMGVDQSLGAFGVDTGRGFENAGTYLGLGSGMGRAGMRALPGLARGSVGRQIAQHANVGGEAAERGMANFGMGTIDPLIGGAKALARKPLEWAGLGRHVQPGGAAGILAKSTEPVSTARGLGRLVGGTGLAAGGVGAGYGLMHDKATEMADQIAAEKLQQLHEHYLPVLKDEAAGFMDNYARSRGLMGEDGKFDASGLAHNAIGSNVDGMLRSLGIDGSRMSPIQKMMLMGGTAAGGMGLATGHPVLAALGGGAALAGAAPAFGFRGLGQTAATPPSPGQFGYGMAAPQGPQGRNEFEHQQHGQ